MNYYIFCDRSFPENGGFTSQNERFSDESFDSLIRLIQKKVSGTEEFSGEYNFSGSLNDVNFEININYSKNKRDRIDKIRVYSDIPLNTPLSLGWLESFLRS